MKKFRFFKIILFTLLIFKILLTSSFSKNEASIITKINNDIITSYDLETERNYLEALSPSIKKLTPEFERSSTLFHSKAEVEDLYNSLSRFAAANGLVISKIEKRKPKPVFKEGQTAQSEDKMKVEMISYFKIPVDYEIKGNFLGYIKFKRAVSKSKKSLNFDKETISVVQNDSTGAIIAEGELTIVGLPNDFF